MSILRLQPQEVAKYWDHIKYAACLVDRVPPNNRPEYCKSLLEDLLCDKAQAWFGLAEDRTVKVSAVTKVQENPDTKIRELFISWIFGYVALTDIEAKEFFDGAKVFAKNIGCSSVRAHSNVPRIWELCELVGAKQPYRVYQVNL